MPELTPSRRGGRRPMVDELWARAKKNRAVSELDRGRWYKVVSREGYMTRLETDDGELEVWDEYLVFREGPPEKATVYGEGRWGSPPAEEMSYSATCPQGHRIGPPLSLSGDTIACPLCETEYPWEFEDGEEQGA